MTLQITKKVHSLASNDELMLFFGINDTAILITKKGLNWVGLS